MENGKVLPITVIRSRVKNFTIKFDGVDDFVFVLPKCVLAEKIAMYFHKKFHKDIDTIVTHIRKEFWIPQLRKIVTKIDKNCQFCLISRQKVSSQLMGSLPECRTTPGKAFECVNLDLFGPLTIKDSVVKRGARVQKKVWGVLFVCTSTRAVHLDVADDYSTQSILHCIRRLKCDRGEISQIISDPGTQLKGAAKELKEVLEGWNKEELIRFGTNNGFEWKFVMANSQHQNGPAEILIKVCKGIMKSLMKAIGTQVLFYNELMTLLKETQQLANERPIGIKPNLNTDQEYLSPNSLLLGRCSARISQGPFLKKIIYDHSPESDKTRFLLIQKITNQFWKNWTNLYFPTLLRRQKWHYKERNLKCGDICVMKDSNAVRGEWKLCKVAETYPDENNVVRNVKVLMPPPNLTDGSKDYKKGIAMIEVKRHVSNLIVIVPNENDDNETAIGEDCSLDL